MKINKLNQFFSTLNFILIFVGYEVATTIFLPLHSDIEGISKLVTVPYRGIALLLALLIIFFNKRNSLKFNFASKILLLYWVLLILRIFSDFYLKSNIYIPNPEKLRLWLYIFGIILIPAYSVVKSYKSIDYESALKWIFCLTLFSLVMSLFSNEMLLEGSTERAEGNIGMNTINTGHLGVTGIILSFFIFFKFNRNFFFKILSILGSVLSALVVLRAGSRGPLLALFVVLLIWLGSRGKNRMGKISLVSGIGILSFVLFDLFLDYISQISPVMALRLEQADPLASRIPLYDTALVAFLENPFLGKQFAIFHKGGFIYSHNLILDSLMGLGIIGGFAILYLILKGLSASSGLISRDDPQFWIGLILIQIIMKGMVSGSFYFSPLITILFPLILFFKKENNLYLSNGK